MSSKPTTLRESVEELEGEFRRHPGEFVLVAITRTHSIKCYLGEGRGGLMPPPSDERHKLELSLGVILAEGNLSIIVDLDREDLNGKVIRDFDEIERVRFPTSHYVTQAKDAMPGAIQGSLSIFKHEFPGLMISGSTLICVGDREVADYFSDARAGWSFDDYSTPFRHHLFYYVSARHLKRPLEEKGMDDFTRHTVQAERDLTQKKLVKLASQIAILKNGYDVELEKLRKLFSRCIEDLGIDKEDLLVEHGLSQDIAL